MKMEMGEFWIHNLRMKKGEGGEKPRISVKYPQLRVYHNKGNRYKEG